MGQHSSRDLALDFLRVIGLGFILYEHSPSYTVPIPILEFFRTAGMYTGLSLFVFLSGYGLTLSSQNKKLDYWQFFVRRLNRLYPLYLLAIVLYAVLFGTLGFYHQWDAINKQSIFLSIFSLQVIFSPVIPPISTIWFIGMIMLFYLFFILSVRSSYSQQIYFCILICFFLLVIRYVFNIIDCRIFLYFPLFVFGCFCARRKFLTDTTKVRSLAGIATASLAIACILYLCFKWLNLPIFVDPPGASNLSSLMQLLPSYTVILLYSSLSVVGLMSLSKVFVYRLPKSFQKIILILSDASYAMYLFHRIIFAIFYYVVYTYMNLDRTLGTLLFPIATLIGIFISYLIIKFIEPLLLRAFSWFLRLFTRVATWVPEV